jgi:hypothetical protein
MASSSVIIRDFYVPGVPLFPPEAHPILIVDADAVLTLSIALQLLQTISWWVSEIVDFCCEVHCLKFADGDSGNLPQLRLWPVSQKRRVSSSAKDRITALA